MSDCFRMDCARTTIQKNDAIVSSLHFPCIFNQSAVLWNAGLNRFQSLIFFGLTNMSIAVETLEKLERRFILNLSKEDIQKEVDRRLKERARTAKAPGFRQGRLPRKMIEAQFGPQAENEVINEKIVAAFDRAVTESGIDVAGRPSFNEVTENVPDGMIAYSATFEVFPEVKIEGLEEVEMEKVVSSVSQEDVDNAIEIIRKRQTAFFERGQDGEYGDGGPDLSAREGDRITIDFVGKIHGVEFEGGKANDFEFTLGERTMLPEFEEAAYGLQKDDVKVFDLTFPENYHGRDVAGQRAEFTITVTKVQWPLLPPIDEDFARSLGIDDGDVQKMREEIAEKLSLEVKNRVAAINKKNVMDILVQKSEFDLPKELLRVEMNTLMENTLRRLESENRSIEGITLPPEMFLAQAQRRVCLGLLFAEFLKDEQFRATADEVRARAEEIASTYENPQMMIDYFLNQRERREEIEAMIMEDKVVKWVLEKGRTTEKALPLSELMAMQV